jgi:hypothetical protein
MRSQPIIPDFVAIVDDATKISRLVITAQEVTAIAETLRTCSEECGRICKTAKTVLSDLETLQEEDVVGPYTKLVASASRCVP